MCFVAKRHLNINSYQKRRERVETRAEEAVFDYDINWKFFYTDSRFYLVTKFESISRKMTKNPSSGDEGHGKNSGCARSRACEEPRQCSVIR